MRKKLILLSFVAVLILLVPSRATVVEADDYYIQSVYRELTVHPDGSFDGIEFGEFKTNLLPWEDDMVHRCLNEIKNLMDDSEPTEGLI